MNRKFWISWVVGAAIALGGYSLFWFTHSNDSTATGGESYQRVGITSAVLAIFVILSPLRLRKQKDPGATAWTAVPVAIAFTALFVGTVAGFLGDDPTACAELQSTFDIVDPTCTTTTGVRTSILIELATLWAVYGALSYFLGRHKQPGPKT